MSRMERVKNALASTLDQLRSQIETTHKNGKIPADYSLGFINGLIFIDHKLNMRSGEPKFYDRTTSIGTLPKPVALNSGNALRDEQTYQFLMDATLLRARQVVGSVILNHETKSLDVNEETVKAIIELKESIEVMEKFISERFEETQNENQEEAKEQQETQSSEIHVQESHEGQ